MVDQIDKAKIIADALGRFAITLNADLESDDPRMHRLNTIYEGTLAQAFNFTTWNFLKATVRCTLIDKQANGIEEHKPWPNGYSHAHAIPGNKMGSIRKILSSEHPSANIRDFEIEGERLFSHCKDVWIAARFAKEPELWPAAWREAFTVLLAGRFSVPETHDTELEDKFLTEALGTPRERAMPGGMFGRLVAQDLAENPPDSPLRSGDPLLDARAGGSGVRRSRPWYGGY
jgi:hypothetical protein